MKKDQKNKKKKVLIVGAGPAGLATYLTLDKEKFDIEIVEKRKRNDRLGYSVIFMPTGVRALKEFGFTSSDINSIGRNFQEIRSKDKNDKLILATDYRSIIKKFDSYMVVTREKLYKLLEKKVLAKHIYFGVSAKSLSKLSPQKLRVQFTGNKKSKEYDIVIGADGTHSFIRNILFPHVKPVPLGLSLIWAWIPRKDRIYPQPGGSMGNEKAGVGFFNSGEQTKSCMAFFIETKAVPENITSADYKELLYKHLKGFKGSMPKILRNLPRDSEMYFHHDYELHLKKWHKGNIILIGDAAHAKSVFTGAGSAMALEDAFVLGRYLNGEDTIKTAIKKYCQSQQPRAEELAMSRIRTYFQDRKGICKWLKKFFASSPLFSMR